jgi:hypothetical protein
VTKFSFPSATNKPACSLGGIWGGESGRSDAAASAQLVLCHSTGGIMAQYKYQQFLKYNSNAVFDTLHLPVPPLHTPASIDALSAEKKMCLLRDIRCRLKTTTNIRQGAARSAGS